MKKISRILLLSCLLFLTLFQVKTEPVLDTNKQAIRPGYTYYILPATTAANGGGLTLAKGENGSCPLDVFQAQNVQSKGLPLKFLMVNSSAGLVIDENEDINIKFAAPRYVSICNKSTVLKIEDGFVTTGGIKGGSENGTATSLFTIQKYEDAYALQYCPRATGCSFICPRLLCGYIGIAPAANGSRCLAVNRPIFKIVFKKA
ncbi:PREDICTED: kunitz trypsin inhibitor 2-like [Nicotiana attenuata]|uniref:21 kDa seed protein n=1 Tax=Nicotiana attenuata TaxID=49451 RepID=A0A314KSF9_NICAT|nr:PREDICTED: kunitz trypsin inhibitor 2-like [Nicotiana attenuata]OIT32037.1 21 kda seed protein [Nicotiana attenuata]